MKIVGHRGARGLAPENTIAALQKGLEHHVDELEFDLRVTKDGVVILSHNKTVADAAGGKLGVATHTYKELKAHKPDLATFTEALDAISQQAVAHIEVKRHIPVTPIVTTIKQYLAKGWKSENFLLGSKHQPTLLALHKALPDIQKVVINAWSGFIARHRAKQVNTTRLSMRSWFLWWGFIAAVHQSGYQLYAYTLNNPKKAKRWAAHGLAGVITDFPDRFEQ